MLVWRKAGGRCCRRDRDAPRLAGFIAGLDGQDAPLRMAGTAVFPTEQAEISLPPLPLDVRHNGIVHRRVVLFKVVTEPVPRVTEHGRLVCHACRRYFSPGPTLRLRREPGRHVGLRAHQGRHGVRPRRGVLLHRP